MSIVGLLCLLFALVASLLLVLYWVQRREIRSVEQLSQQVQRIAIGGRLDGERSGVIVVSKLRSTPDQFPRRVGIPGKRPL